MSIELSECKSVDFEWAPLIKCAVESCTNLFEKYTLSSPLKFYNFPQHKELFNLWRDACKIPHHHSTENLKICSDHFNTDDYEIIFDSNMKTKILKPNAVPHCNLSISNVEQEMEQAMEENYLLKSNMELLEKEKTELQNKIEKMNAKLTNRLKLTQQLKVRCEQLKKKYDGSQRKNLLAKVFSCAQIGVLLRKRKVVWSDDDLAMAFTLRHMGSKECYLYLKQILNFPLPALSCVQKWAASLHET